MPHLVGRLPYTLRKLFEGGAYVSRGVSCPSFIVTSRALLQLRELASSGKMCGRPLTRGGMAWHVWAKVLSSRGCRRGGWIPGANLPSRTIDQIISSFSILQPRGTAVYPLRNNVFILRKRRAMTRP